MQEEVLRKFFEGQATAAELATDIAGSTKHYPGGIVATHSIQDMDAEHQVTRQNLISLCDAVLAGALPAQALGDIGFALVASDHFVWDAEEDELLGDVIYDWSCPQVNYPLTTENVLKFRACLLSELTYPF